MLKGQHLLYIVGDVFPVMEQTAKTYLIHLKPIEVIKKNALIKKNTIYLMRLLQSIFKP